MSRTIQIPRTSLYWKNRQQIKTGIHVRPRKIRQKGRQKVAGACGLLGRGPAHRG